MQPAEIRTAIIGIGNCASALVQGVHFYTREREAPGMIHRQIGGYGPEHVRFVLGIDVDVRKVGKDLSQAVFAKPNNTTIFEPDLPWLGAPVIRGPVLDGVAEHMRQAGERGFQPIAGGAEPDKAAIVRALQESRTEILLNFLPVGSQEAVEFYMECALEAGVGVVNCMPVLIASDPAWEARFRARGLPIVGDDIKAQVGATIVHRTLSSLFTQRGVKVERTYQLNTGGNTDFMNMLDRTRLATKKRSKTEAVQATLAARLADENILIGPSEYVAWQKDNKLAFMRLEGVQWGNVPLHVELRLSVEDSPNAAACVMDALRLCKLALDHGEAGALAGPSAYYCKHPPRQLPEHDALALLEAFVAPRAQAAE